MNKGLAILIIIASLGLGYYLYEKSQKTKTQIEQKTQNSTIANKVHYENFQKIQQTIPKKVCSIKECPPGWAPQPIMVMDTLYQGLKSPVDIWVDGKYAGRTQGQLYTDLFTPCQWHKVIAKGKDYYGKGKLGYFCYPGSAINDNLLLVNPI